jgi:DHA1 family bicyclomycin/chloramphenicol resistance-like MFS transporter
MVRDLHSGRAMARIMSFVMAVFILVPMLAPSVGQLVLLLADWRVIFYGLVIMGIIDFLWLWLRQPETLAPKDRVPLSITNVLRGAREAVSNRVTIGYTIATGLVFGAFISYLGTSQQIFQEQYGTGKLFSVYFGILAAGIGVASITNARLVMRFGMRNLSKWALRSAAALTLVFIPIAWALGGHPPLWLFVSVMTVLFFFNGLLFGNYNALAMEPMGHIAGVASAVIGSLSSLIAVSVGTPIGRFYDGTVIPVISGFALMALLAIAATEWAEIGRRPPPPITPS